MPTAKKSLPAKLADITGALAHVEKKGFNKTQHYSFARESDIAAEASKLFAEHNIWMAQNIVGEPVTTEMYQTRSGATMYLTTLVLEVTFHDGDSDATLGPLRFAGSGADTGDKGVYKAMTGAEKYALMKLFLIATGDDPEQDEKVDKAAAGAAAGAGARVKGGKAKAGTKRGGKSDGISDPQVGEITRLVREKGISKPGFMAVLSMVVDDIAPDSDLMEVIRGLSSKQAGEVIKGLNDVEIVEDDGGETVDEDGGEDVEQETMSIV